MRGVEAVGRDHRRRLGPRGGPRPLRERVVVQAHERVQVAARLASRRARAALSRSSKQRTRVGDHHVVVDELPDGVRRTRRRPALYASISGFISCDGREVEAERADAVLAGLAVGRRVAARDPDRRVARRRTASGGCCAARRARSGCPGTCSPSAPTCAGSPTTTSSHSARVDDGVVDVERRDLVAAGAAAGARTRSGRSVRWSSIATRSALRTGWLTRGAQVEDARAHVDALGARRRDSPCRPRWPRCGCTPVSAWCSVTHTYFQLLRSAHFDELDLVA